MSDSPRVGEIGSRYVDIVGEIGSRYIDIIGEIGSRYVDIVGEIGRKKHGLVSAGVVVKNNLNIFLSMPLTYGYRIRRIPQ